MGVASKRLDARLLTTAAATTMRTVPSGETMLVKTLTIQNISGAAVTVSFYMVVGATIFGFMVETVGAGLSINRQTWVVGQPGDSLGAVASVANAARVAAYGSELEGVAD